MGWEPTFPIGAFGLSEEMSTMVGFAFSNNGLNSQDLQLKKYIYDIFDNVSWDSYLTFDIPLLPYMSFSHKKMHY